MNLSGYFASMMTRSQRSRFRISLIIFLFAASLLARPALMAEDAPVIWGIGTTDFVLDKWVPIPGSKTTLFVKVSPAGGFHEVFVMIDGKPVLYSKDVSSLVAHRDGILFATSAVYGDAAGCFFFRYSTGLTETIASDQSAEGCVIAQWDGSKMSGKVRFTKPIENLDSPGYENEFSVPPSK